MMVNMLINFKFTILLLVVTTVVASPSEAKRHKKFKGIVIVNQVLKLRGTLTNNGQQAMEFSGVKEGDLLETGPNSMAIVRIPGLLVMRLAEQTKVKLTKFGNRDRSQIDVIAGQVLFMVKRLGDHAFNFPEAVVKPQGAATQIFLIQAEQGLGLWDGKIKISSKNFKGAPVKSSEPVATAEIKEEKPNEAPLGSNIAVLAKPENRVIETPLELSEITLASSKTYKWVQVKITGLTIQEAVPSAQEKITTALPEQIQELDSLYSLP